MKRKTVAEILSENPNAKLYLANGYPNHWVGTDSESETGFSIFPAEKNGWAKKKPYTGPRAHLL